MKDGKGYLLPENPHPEGLRCLKVWIPDDPRYLEAFSGQFHDLGTWLAWEKDGTHRASLAAIAWKDAIDYTYENGWLNCGDDMDCCQEILDRLDDLESLIKNKTCSCESPPTSGGDGNMCCCCGCGDGASSPPVDPPDYIEPPPPPSTVPPPSELPLTWVCDAAHQIVDNWALYWSNAAAASAGGLALEIALSFPIVFLVPSAYFIALVVSVVGSWTAGSLFNYVSNWFVTHHDNLVCLLVNAGTASLAKGHAVQYTKNVGGNPPGGLLAGIVEYLVLRTYDISDWNMYFEPGSFEIEPENIDSDCTACSSVPPPPDPGTEPPPGETPSPTSILFHNVDIAGSLGESPVQNGLNVWFWTLYGVRLKHISGSTWSGWRSSISMVNPIAGQQGLNELANMKLVIAEIPGHSGFHEGVQDIIRFNAYDQSITVDYWTNFDDPPVEIVGQHRWMVYDSENEADVWFWFEPWP